MPPPNLIHLLARATTTSSTSTSTTAATTSTSTTAATTTAASTASSTTTSSTSTSTSLPCSGCLSASHIPNAAFFALFALLGLALAAGFLWFTLRAKNGGFRYRAGDWDDYASTVLRRKGPDGRSVVSSRPDSEWDARTAAVEARVDRARCAALSVVARDQKGRLGILAKRGWGGTHAYAYADDITNYDGEKLLDAESEVGYDMYAPAAQTKLGGRGDHARRYRDRDPVAAYKREKPARVGGINRVADGSHADANSSYGGSGRGADEGKARGVADEAARMERQWRREARRAAADMARGGDAESQRSGGSSRGGSPVKRGGAGSPIKKREGGREASYYDAYRPSRY